MAMSKTVLATARVTGGSHNMPTHPEGESLKVDLEMGFGGYVEHVDAGRETALFTAPHFCRQRRLAFDIAKDGSVKVRLPVGSERRQVLTSPHREDDLQALRAALGIQPHTVGARASA